MPKMTTSGLDYLVVDVFVGADGAPFAGNPLAVVLGGDDLTTAQCQALASEFHLSETAFPMAPTGRQADYRLRIFTITSELPFAGHPSIGAAWVLGHLESLSAGTVTQECGAGLVSLEVPSDGGAVTLTGPPPTMSEPVDPAPLLASVGLTDADLAGPAARTGGSGISFSFLNVRPDALARARPDLTAMSSLPAATTGVYLFAVHGQPHADAPLQIRARMFVPDIGGEDPATGSAALGLGGWLVASGLAAGEGPTAYSITQGVEMGRPSELLADVTAHRGEITRVRVSGRVAAVARGRIRVPAVDDGGLS
jgi:trans-2,3-dihydro-3-hydroxyanthranilate isomerase